MTIRLRDLIKQVRAARTAAAERDVIAKESAALRQAFKEQDSTYRHRNVAKLMYIHMLGYPSHFGQMETLKLIASSSYPEKRIGYLGLMLLLDERQEVLMLVTNSLKNDLRSRTPYITALALSALGTIASAGMARDLSPEVEALLRGPNPYLRKKAALCALRVVQKVPDLAETFGDLALKALSDGNHGVLLASCSLLQACCRASPAFCVSLRAQVPALCRLLKGLLAGSSGTSHGAPAWAPDVDVGGVCNPFLQVGLLRLLRLVCGPDAAAADAASDTLAAVVAGTSPARNGGAAVLYECVRCVLSVPCLGSLRVLAVNTLGAFLANQRDSNLRYVALDALALLAGGEDRDAAPLQRHRAVVVQCVRDADASIRRRALELLAALATPGNAAALAGGLLDYFELADREFKAPLAARVAALARLRLDASPREYVDLMAALLSAAREHVRREDCDALAAALTAASRKTAAYGARALWRACGGAAGARDAPRPLLLCALWAAGEHGDALVGASARLTRAEGEPELALEAEDVAAFVEAGAARADAPEARAVALTAAAKLAARLPDARPRLERLVAGLAAAPALELQVRAVEYGRLLRAPPQIRAQVLDRVPPPDARATGADDDLIPDDAALAAAAAHVAGGADLAALLGLDGPGGGSAGDGAAGGRARPDADPLAGLDDLLGGGGGAVRRPAAAPAAQEPSFPPAGGPAMVVFDKEGLRVTFYPARAPEEKGASRIRAVVENSGAQPVAAFSLQAAVPKFMQLRLDAASAADLPAGGGKITQTLHVTNSQQGARPLVMRLRVSFTRAGEERVEQVEVDSFPKDL